MGEYCIRTEDSIKAPGEFFVERICERNEGDLAHDDHSADYHIQIVVHWKTIRYIELKVISTIWEKE